MGLPFESILTPYSASAATTRNKYTDGCIPLQWQSSFDNLASFSYGYLLWFFIMVI